MIRVEDHRGPDSYPLYTCPHEPQHDTHEHWVDDDPLNMPGVEWYPFDCDPHCEELHARSF